MLAAASLIGPLLALLVGAIAAPSSALAAGWSAPKHIDVSDADLVSVSCASASLCIAIDSRGNAFTYSGSSWSAPEDIEGQRGLDSVSCPSTSFCAAVDGAGSVLTYNCSSWSAPTPIEEGTPLDSVSCASASFCAAVDAVGNALTYNGSSWSAPVVLDRAGNASSAPADATRRRPCAAPSGRSAIAATAPTSRSSATPSPFRTSSATSR
jgi:hypothetical protein